MLHDGDLLSIDIGTTLDGYVSDSAVTVAESERFRARRRKRLLDVTQECLMVGIAAMQARQHASATSVTRCKSHAENNGYGVVRELVGHGVGREMHEEPQVPNYGKPGHRYRSCVRAWFWPSSR